MTHTIRKYQLLILNGHASHKLAEFNLFYKNHQIISLYIPSHSLDKLQPLNISCFAPLKEAYRIEVIRSIKNDIHHINKENFLNLYRESRKALSSKNIYSSFTASGLVPLDPQRVLDKLIIKNITPPTTAHGPPTDAKWIAKTPYTTTKVQRQIELIKQLIKYNSQSPPTKAIHQLAKAAKSTMHKVLLLDQEIKGLHTANKKQKQKHITPRSYIITRGVLTGAKGQ
jgi:hypothetical protein